MMIFSIDDGNGNQIAAGLLGYDAARETAQRIANERGELVYLYRDDVDGDYEEIAPVEVIIIVSVPRPSVHLSIAGALALDVNVTLTLSTGTVYGEATIAPGVDGVLRAYGGQPDHWVSGDLLRHLRTLDDQMYRAALEEIERAAVAAAQEVV